MSANPRGPRIVIDFTDELLRQLCAPMVKEAIKEVLLEESSLDANAAAEFLAMSITDFRRKAHPKLPEVDHGERSTRYRLKDLIAYRDKKVTYPKK